MKNKNTFDLIFTLPKVLLHTHLEGSIPVNTLKLLRDRNNIHLPFEVDSEAISNKIISGNWQSFRDIFYPICSCFINWKDFYDALYGYGVELNRQNVVYAEIQFSPWRHMSRGISLEAISKGLFEAVLELKKNNIIEIKLICDLVRKPEEPCDMIIDWLLDLPKDCFVAMGISGGTGSIERKKYLKHCERVKSFGLNIVAHAGELEGYLSVQDAIQFLLIDRVGHGLRSVENNQFFEQLLQQNLHFELCPTANEIIGISDKSTILIQTLIEKGGNFSINTDDELIFNTNITKEICKFVDYELIEEAAISKIMLNSINSSFLTQLEKQTLIRKHYALH